MHQRQIAYQRDFYDLYAPWTWISFYYAKIPEDLADFLAKNGQFRLFKHASQFYRLECYGLFVLSTCNRFDLLLGTDDLNYTLHTLEHILWDGQASYRSHMKIFQGLASWKKFLEIFLGLDSIALGESEIRGQMRQALMHSHQYKQDSPLLRSLVGKLFEKGKKILKELDPKREKNSYSRMVLEHLPPVEIHPNILVLGAGKIARSVIEGALKAGYRQISVSNRCLEKALYLKNLYRLDGDVIPFESFKERLTHFHVIVAATSSQKPLLTSHSPALENHHLQVVFDLSMPHNIEKEWAEQHHIPLFHLFNFPIWTDIYAQEQRQALSLIDREVQDLMRSWEQSRQAASYWESIYHIIKTQIAPHEDPRYLQALMKKIVSRIKTQGLELEDQQKVFSQFNLLESQAD